MRALTGAKWAVVSALLLALAASAGEAASKPRNVLILPYAPVDLGRDEQWIGEGIAQSLMLSLVNVPGLVQIERERVPCRSPRRGTRPRPPRRPRSSGRTWPSSAR